jgi:hypothetical protein
MVDSLLLIKSLKIVLTSTFTYNAKPPNDKKNSHYPHPKSVYL